MKDQVKITFERDGRISVSKEAGVSSEEFIEAVSEFAKMNGRVITEIETGAAK